MGNYPAPTRSKNSLLDKTESDLAHELKNLCDRNGKELKPQQSAQILHRLGLVYFKRSVPLKQDDENRSKMMNFIKSACLLNAAIARKPKNTMAVTEDLKTLCREVLINAGARDVTADLIAQSKIVKEDIEAMRKMVRHKLNDIQELQKQKCSELEQERYKIQAIKTLQNQITCSYTNIMADILNYCLTTMGDSPCNFALVGMGSLARKEITPYSDFEHIIVLGKKSEQRSDYENILQYFRWLSVVFQFVLINLQETILPSVNICSLKDQNNKQWFYDDITTRGVCFDGMMPHACKFPLGRTEPTETKEWTTELIKPIDQMLAYLTTEEDLKNGYHLKDILTKVCYVGGDKLIFDEFQRKAYDKLNQENHEEKVNSIKQILIEDLDNFATRSNLLEFSSKSFNIKKDFYRSSTLFISALGQLNNIEVSSCFDISEALEKKNVITNKVKHYQMYAVALACELRLKWYMKQERQDDTIRRNEAEDRDSIEVLLNIMKASDVIKYFQIAYALQCDISKQFGLKKIHFYTDSKLLNLKLYYSFGKLNKFNNFLKVYVKTEFDKTPRLYSTEKIIDHLVQETNQLQQNPNHNLPPETESLENDTEKLVYDLAMWLKEGESYDEAKELFEIHLDMMKKTTKQLDHSVSNQTQNTLNKKTFPKTPQKLVNLVMCKSVSTIDSDHKLFNQLFTNDLDQIGLCLMNMQKPDEAIIYLQKSLKFYQNVSLDSSVDKNVASTLNNIGLCLMNTQQFDEAITYLQKSLTIYQNVSLDSSVDFNVARTLNNVGSCLKNMRKPYEAITYLQRSLTIYEKAPYNLVEVSIALTLNNVVLCLMDMHKHDEAISHLQRSLTIYQNESLDLSIDINVSTTLNNIGLCLMNMQHSDEAITYLQRSLIIYQNVSLDSSVDINVATTLNNIGSCLMEMHKPDEAITNLQKSLTIDMKASHDLSVDRKVAALLNNIGLRLMEMHKPDEAIIHLQRSLTISEKSSPDLSVDTNVAKTLNNIALCLMEMHKPDEAITYLQKFLTIYEKISYDLSVDVNVARTLDNIGLCLIKMQKPNEALIHNR